MGNAGDLRVRASESVEVSGKGDFSSGLFTTVRSDAEGHGGNLTIETGRLSVRDGAGVLASTFGMGDAGNLTVLVSESVELINEGDLSVTTEGDGDGGALTIETGRLVVQDGAQVKAGTFGTGQGGTLSVTALEYI